VEAESVGGDGGNREARARAVAAVEKGAAAGS